MKTLTYIFATFLLLMALAGCINNRQGKNEHSNSTEQNIAQQNGVATSGSEVLGNYRGVLPCTDCQGIETILQIKADKSYRLSTKYLGKSDENFIKAGRWKIHASTLSLEGIDYKFKIFEDHLGQLDLSGNDMRGDLADQYLLSKIEN
ncbi:copper resistance protein NlpE [Sphingobacterium sp. SYP-B4668]|uniref:copper resistance protein NlpE n=1 Tax=Sphingobacterium sp. SYP-B4668 TaxID=2996035 RepID=UPI0022DE3C2F|nr:copper resistance protein NlpE [Sphingobacterium sp. SYP-B4668]